MCGVRRIWVNPVVWSAGSGILAAMAFGKTEEQKAAEAAAKARAQYEASPLGQAEAARQRGDAFFQVEIGVASLTGASSSFGASTNRVHRTGGRPDLLGQIEEMGWRLEHVGYVFIETGSTTSNRVLSTGQGTVTRGEVVGIYLFRAM